MAIVSWLTSGGKSTKKHEEGLGQTLCGLDIPHRGKEWNAFGESDCKRCIKAKAKLEQE